MKQKEHFYASNIAQKVGFIHLIYDLAIRLLIAGIHAASYFIPKAKLWVQGRDQWRKKLHSWIDQGSSSKVLWVHAASLGEFEQGRPVIETFREQYPDWKIVLSFFSPSGYEVRKDYPHADLVCYLPADTRQNARDFLKIIQPEVAVFVKYEFWANYLLELKKLGVPTLLVSALFRPSQPFFQAYGRFWKQMLGCFTHIFVQNESSGKLLKSIGFQEFTVAGDTRVDRVLKIAANAPENAVVRDFVALDSRQTLVVGSSWEADETVIFQAIQKENPAKQSDKSNWKLIIAPHEPSAANVQRINQHLENAWPYSQLPAGNLVQPGTSHLIIDNIGLLNTLYRYGTVAYIGGGFGKGIHNTLEPAAFGLPVIFGPKYEKFEEARQFVARGGAFPVQNAVELAAILTKLEDPVFYQRASGAVRAYLEESRGATEKVMLFVKEVLPEKA